MNAGSIHRADRTRLRVELRAMTLVEVLVAVAILVLLLSLLLVATKTVQAASRKTRARAQIQLLAAAIDRYAGAWPMWRDAAGNPVADRAWPHWSTWALFPSPPYDYTSPICGMLNPTPPNPSPFRVVADDDDLDTVGQFTGRNDVGQASACLAYELTTPGPNLTVMKDDAGMFKLIGDREYPALNAGNPTTNYIRLALDPWTHPVRYFWVARDSHTTNPTGWRAITSADPANLANPSSDPPPADAFYARAQGFVIESAGPDGRFGNIWKPNPTQQELDDASDNITVRP